MYIQRCIVYVCVCIYIYTYSYIYIYIFEYVYIYMYGIEYLYLILGIIQVGPSKRQASVWLGIDPAGAAVVLAVRGTSGPAASRASDQAPERPKWCWPGSGHSGIPKKLDEDL